MDSPIIFPGLGNLTLPVQRVAFHLFKIPVYWYGILIAAGMLLAFFYAYKRSKQFDITFDDLTDVTLWGIIFGIIGARLFYVLFYIDPSTGLNPYFSDPVSMLKIWKGGLAIYGGIIGAFVTALVFCRIKKQNPLKYLDIASLGFLIGQAVGRWGNFFNREAYGAATKLPWRMEIDSTGVGYHPCFLYESLWCALGFLALHFYSKRRKFTGEIFLMYAAWYSLGRFFIEGLRTDSLMIGGVRVSQLISALVFIIAVTIIIIVRIRLRAKENESLEYENVYSDIMEEMSEGGDDSSEGETDENAEDASEDRDVPEDSDDSGDADGKTEEPKEDGPEDQG